MTEEITSDDITQVMDRIARTADGQLLYRYLQKVRLGVTTPNMPGRALRANEGRRSFAADLMAHMGKGIADSDRYAVTFAIAEPVDTRTHPRGARRRVTLDTAIAGWDTDANSGSGTSGSTN
jgi:hypothetical protein